MKVISDSQIFSFLVENVSKETILSDFQPLILEALKSYQDDPSRVPNRIVSNTSTEGSDMTHLFMPCILPKNVGLKVVSGGPTNVQKRIGFQGVVNIIDEYTGALKAVLNAKTLTAFRTALASSVALVKALDVNDNMKPISVLVFGAGPQAFWHVFLATRLYNVHDVTIISRRLESAETLASQLSGLTQAALTTLKWEDHEKVREHVSRCVIVFGCTPSTEGIIRSEFLDADPNKIKFVSLIGSYKPHMIELDLDFLIKEYKVNKSKIIVDSVPLCLDEAGEIVQARVDENLLESVADLPEGPLSKNFFTLTGVVVCKMVGLLAEDIVVAKYLADRISGTQISDF